MTHHIFLIHGMGDFQDKWSEQGNPSITKQIDDLFAKYDDTRSRRANFVVHELNYNKVFESWRKKWADLSKSATAMATALKIPAGLAKQLINLGRSAAGGGFLRTHVLDVALYRLARPVTEEVMSVVQGQIADVFEKPAKAGQPIEYTIIAHSLGTVVAYEAFHAAMTAAAALAPSARPNNVFMVANTTAALWQRGPSIYLPDMAPNLRFTDGWCYHLANFGHRLDPVARLRPFDPPDAWFQPGKKQNTYTDVWLEESDVQSLNVHSLSHYLSHPSVHIPMLRRLIHPSVIEPGIEAAAIQAWRNQRDDIFRQKAEDDLGKLLMKLSPDLMDQLALIKAFRELILNSDDPTPDGDQQ